MALPSVQRLYSLLPKGRKARRGFGRNKKTEHPALCAAWISCKGSWKPEVSALSLCAPNSNIPHHNCLYRLSVECSKRRKWRHSILKVCACNFYRQRIYFNSALCLYYVWIWNPEILEGYG